MRILLDECLPRRLGRLLPGHDVRTVRQMDWLGLSNGRLLAAADPHFDAFITVDKNLVRQQPSSVRRLAIVIVRANSNTIEDLEPLVPQIRALLTTLEPGQVAMVPS